MFVEIHKKLINLDHAPVIEMRNIKEPDGEKFYIEFVGIAKFLFEDEELRNREFERLCKALAG